MGIPRRTFETPDNGERGKDIDNDREDKCDWPVGALGDCQASQILIGNSVGFSGVQPLLETQ